MLAVKAIRRGITWRPRPGMVLICGCLVAMLSYGPRSALGFFLTPMSTENGWGRDVFSVALAIQNLLYGVAQPFAGAIADRYGALRVISGGGILYALGLLLMANAHSSAALEFSAGPLVGLGLAGCSFTIVLAAFGKLLPERWRSAAFGAGAAAGSFGQFLFSPLAVALNDACGWRGALFVFSLLCVALVPMSIVLSTSPNDDMLDAMPSQSLTQAVREALSHRSYLLLVLGFFTCGFQLAFVTVHMPPYLVDLGLSAYVGGWTIGVIGLFNIIGSVAVGWLGARLPKHYILSAIYLLRAVAIIAFISFPVTPTTALGFGAAIGLLWMSTVPPTNGLIARMFGTRWLAMLAGFAFFSHQVGSFLGVLAGGIAYERTGSYEMVWWLTILLSVLSALLNLPIVEKPIERPAPVPT